MEFRNEYFFLSNFYPAVVYGYSTVEHAYQAAKTTDAAERTKIRAARTPAEVKRLGRRVHLRPDWAGIKDMVMETLLRRKFKNYPALSRALLETGKVELVETNTWHDSYWGECNCRKCPTGENRLGKLLMKLRDEFAVSANPLI